jgi:hypothetical protein
MSGVFRNIDPPHTLTARLWCGRRTHSPGGEGVGGQDARHCSVLALYMYVLCGLEHLTRIGQVATVMNSIPASSDTLKSEGRQMN